MAKRWYGIVMVVMGCALCSAGCGGLGRGPRGTGDDEIGSVMGDGESGEIALGDHRPDTANIISVAFDNLLFEYDSAQIGPKERQKIEDVASYLRDNPGTGVIIEGHCDERGTNEYNLALGARRANAVQEYLISRGVASSRLRVISYGKERPIELCSDEACYSQNRRAVTVISAGLSG